MGLSTGCCQLEITRVQRSPGEVCMPAAHTAPGTLWALAVVPPLSLAPPWLGARLKEERLLCQISLLSGHSAPLGCLGEGRPTSERGRWSRGAGHPRLGSELDGALGFLVP